MAKKVSIILLSILLTALAAVAVAATALAIGFGLSGKNDALTSETTQGSTSTNGTGSSSPETNNPDTTSPDTSKPETSNPDTGVTDKDTHKCSFELVQKVTNDCVTDGYDLYKCSCGKEEKRNVKPATGIHDYKTVTHSATCTTDWYQADECKVCGAVKSGSVNTVEDTKTAHKYDWKETKAATCTDDGLKTGVCDDCGDTTTEKIDALDHKYGTYISNNDASCTKDGTKTAECSRCGAEDTQTIVGTVTGHSFANYTYNNDASCSKNGTKTGECVTCKATETIADPSHPATAHKYVGYEWNDGDCVNKGYVKQRCSECKAENVVLKDYGSHDISGHECTLCGETFKGTSGTFSADVHNASGATVSDFGSITVEFEYITYQKYKLIYTMNIVQTYTLNGQQIVEKYDVTVRDSMDGAGFFNFKLYSTKEKRHIEFTGWIDFTVHENEGWMTFTIGCNDKESKYPYTYTFENTYNLNF